MSGTSLQVVFWQRMVTSHVVGLADYLARLGHDVTYVAEEEILAQRRSQGWQLPNVQAARLLIAGDENKMLSILDGFGPNTHHICQGLRGNGAIRNIQQRIASRNQRYWIIMETVRHGGYRGILRSIVYYMRFAMIRRSLTGVLAIGARTPDWVQRHGVAATRVFPFAYFLAPIPHALPQTCDDERVTLAFAGQLISRKGVDRLMAALSNIRQRSLRLRILGSGPEEKGLRRVAESLPNVEFIWYGTVPQEDVPSIVVMSDLLVLPSRFDGWGAIASEALQVGTPVVCSSACGVSEVVQHAPYSEVFENDSELALALERAIDRGPIDASKRSKIRCWSTCIGAAAGAKYLEEILLQSAASKTKPKPTWRLDDL